MKIFNWQPGRQKGCDYLKFPLWFFKLWKLGTDAYILKYSQNSILNPHIDPVGNGKHYRLNIGWGRSKFICEQIIFQFRVGMLSIYLFRPDLYEHSLYIFEKTYKLSIGVVVYN